MLIYQVEVVEVVVPRQEEAGLQVEGAEDLQASGAVEVLLVEGAGLVVRLGGAEGAEDLQVVRGEGEGHRTTQAVP